MTPSFPTILRTAWEPAEIDLLVGFSAAAKSIGGFIKAGPLSSPRKMDRQARLYTPTHLHLVPARMLLPPWKCLEVFWGPDEFLLQRHFS